MRHIMPITRPIGLCRIKNNTKFNFNNEIEKIKWTEIYGINGRHFILIINNGMFAEVDDKVRDVLKKQTMEPENDVIDEMETLWRAGFFADSDGFDKCDREMKLQSVNINVSQRCNLSCAYCFAGGGSYGQPECDISKDMLIMTMDNSTHNISAGETINFVLFGGEPTLRKDLLQVAFEHAKEIEEARKCIVVCDVFTNGTLLDKEFVDNIVDNPRIRLLISLDGPPHLNSKSRKAKNGQDVCALIENNTQEILRIPRNRIVIRATISGHEPCIIERIKYFMQLGYENFVFDVAYGVDLDSNMTLKKVEEELHDLASYLVIQLKMHKRININLLSENMAKILQNNPHSQNAYAEHCPSGRKYIAVDTHGDVYPCHFLVGNNKYRMGSIVDNQYDLRNMIQDNGVSDFSKMKFGKCPECPYHYVCGGACAYKQLELYHEYNSVPNASCELVAARFRESMRVLAEVYQRDNWPYREAWKKLLGVNEDA